MKKTIYIQEVMECFMKQYPEKIEDYFRLLQGSLDIDKWIDVYNDMLEMIPTILIIVDELEEEC